MKSSGVILRIWSVVLITLAVACTKRGDDHACPLKTEDGAGQKFVEDGSGIPADIAVDRPQGSNRDPLLNGIGGGNGDGSISDDGDDEADGEGSNKRGRNN